MCYAPFLLVLSVRIRDTPCFNFLGFGALGFRFGVVGSWIKGFRVLVA